MGQAESRDAAAEAVAWAREIVDARQLDVVAQAAEAGLATDAEHLRSVLCCSSTSDERHRGDRAADRDSRLVASMQRCMEHLPQLAGEPWPPAPAAASAPSERCAAAAAVSESLLVAAAALLRGGVVRAILLAHSLEPDGALPLPRAAAVQQLQRLLQALFGPPAGVGELAQHLLAAAGGSGAGSDDDNSSGAPVTHQTLQNLLKPGTLAGRLVDRLLAQLLGLGALLPDLPSHGSDRLYLAPPLRLPPADTQVDSALLAAPDLTFLEAALGSAHRGPWARLYSSRDNGKSFSSFSAKIAEAGATVLVVRDEDGHVFGGHAVQDWKIGPKFYGTAENFVFSLRPKMAVFRPSGHNQNFQYFNSGMEMLPNGLGFGGQLDYFGLWLDASFDEGHSKAHPLSSTYRSPMLSAKETFRVAVVEVWRVGEAPVPKPSRAKKSVLDYKEERALLDMAGKKHYSEGLRPEDADPDDDEDEATAELHAAMSR